MGTKLKAYLQLCRPANLPTAVADIIAGAAIGGFYNEMDDFQLPYLLIIASVCLYASGVVFNDYFDASIDAIERPERPIPKGVVSKREVLMLGVILILMGILIAFFHSQISGYVAIGLALSILAYDAFSKRYSALGPLNMGLCRGLNLLLGISVVGTLAPYQYMVIPILFIGAVTLISRGEVYGSNKRNILFSGFLYLLAIFLVLALNGLANQLYPETYFFLALFSFMVFLPLGRAFRENEPENIRTAVKFGVLGIVPLDAALASSHAGWQIGLLVLLLLPVSILLSKLFAVT